ncbi:MAG TPA: hypothetical protein VE736_08410 [Gaiellaceae bacterium]|nr:hypothetical protein [Gaiellaceae bacterium]
MAATRTRGRPPKLLVELFVIAAVMAAAAISVYFGFRAPPIHDELPLGGRNVDVSNSSAAQFEASVAVDPTEPKRLLAASMDDLADARAYASTDGGVTWTSQPAPPSQRGACGLSHPDVAIGGRGLELYASLVTDTCQPPDPLLFVATRHGISATWRVRRVGSSGRYVFDQRPSVAVDAARRAYIVWPRLVGEFSSRQVVLFSRSPDGGATWSKPVQIGRYSGVYGVDLAAARNGDLYLAVSDGLHRRIDLLRSTTGGSTWTPARRVARLAVPYVVGCGAGAAQVRAQPQRCISAVAHLALTPRTVAIVYGDADRDGTYAVYVSTFDRALRTFGGTRDVRRAGKGRADQFLPTVAYDATIGDLWLCYYDTRGDSTRKHAWYTCTVSRDDGRTWARPVHAASAKSDETETGSDALGYGDVEGLAAADGVAHPVWTDNRNSLSLAEEIYTAAIPASRLGRR